MAITQQVQSAEHRPATIDAIAKGLDVAKSLFGLDADTQKLELMKRDQANKEAAAQQESDRLASPLHSSIRSVATKAGIQLPDDMTTGEFEHSPIGDYIKANLAKQADQAARIAEAGAKGDQDRKTIAFQNGQDAAASQRNKDAAIQSDDPARLVAVLVPKERQEKALEEVKKRQDLKNLTPQIMAAFERGTSRNPAIAAQGKREFEGLINTTVHETEDTARQAAFDSIHNTMSPSGTFAFPGENDARRRTVLEYLQSKMAAPHTRAYGIDLDKFASTAPYREEPKFAGGGDDGSAYAGPPKTSFNAEDLAALQAARSALAKDPKNPAALETLGHLRAKGLQ